MKKVVKKMRRDKNSCKPNLCSFGSLDYMILASTLAIALGEELDQNELAVLASFFAVLSDELALISAIEACNSGTPDEDTFVAPVPSVATTSLDESNATIKKNIPTIKKKKIIKKTRKKRRKV
ncbi:MAG: hypothetical protein ACRC92_07365 [Peptostreptococcaceae bacterium]